MVNDFATRLLTVCVLTTLYSSDSTGLGIEDQYCSNVSRRRGRLFESTHSNQCRTEKVSGKVFLLLSVKFLKINPFHERNLACMNSGTKQMMDVLSTQLPLSSYEFPIPLPRLHSS